MAGSPSVATLCAWSWQLSLATGGVEQYSGEPDSLPVHGGWCAGISEGACSKKQILCSSPPTVDTPVLFGLKYPALCPSLQLTLGIPVAFSPPIWK